MKKSVIVLSVLYFVALSNAQAPDTLWTRTYGGIAYDVAYSVQQTADGGYIIAGRAGSGDVYLIKTDSLGDSLWTKTYGGSAQDKGWSVQQTTDGGYIVVGEKGVQGDVYLIKTNSLGDTLWTRTFGDSLLDWGLSVQQTIDGGYIITGHKQTSTNVVAILIKTDSLGDSLWARMFFGDGGAGGYSVQQTTDGGYIITGYSSDPTGTFVDVYLVKTDSLGDSLWTRTYGGSMTDVGWSVQQTTDMGYIITGYTGLYDVYLIKTDSLGDSLWTKTYGGNASDYGLSVQQTADGGYIITGSTDSYGAGDADVYLIKTDSFGDTLWTRTFGGSDWDAAYSGQQTTDGGYIIAGGTYNYGAGSADVYLIKTASETGIEEEKIVRHGNGHETLGATIVRGPLLLPKGKNCRVFDITGRVVMPDKIKPGIYFIEVDGVISHKVIKIK